MNHIELFSGCGGLCLGLDKAGFELVLANELSPMAAESFAYNFFNEDLEDKSNENLQPENAVWINSQFADLKSRLRENPFSSPKFKETGHSDLPANFDELNGKLIVGSIIELNRLIEDSPKLAWQLKDAFGRDGGWI
ncbi:DNA cytosine methyltransferase [Psychrosphaera algicola]|uniref:DNA cytosine methyltransferase n=1 Tax=Psychrosphaera algicola TaxID=3023714 RepID=A0ABT5FBC5_9GAMM|nr:DNA cytosine methyltransferase [Psychrosphaera sp. G1-22]MDC2888701.1 DNA cytosine methyltransferase [Psychrosphaera sp. G1-22]